MKQELQTTINRAKDAAKRANKACKAYHKAKDFDEKQKAYEDLITANYDNMQAVKDLVDFNEGRFDIAIMQGVLFH